jgi:hypothetical protein
MEAARSTIANPPPDDLGKELTFRWQVVQSAVTLASGDTSGAQSMARSMLITARQKGYQPAITCAEHMLAHPDLPVETLLRLVLIGEAGLK